MEPEGDPPRTNPQRRPASARGPATLRAHRAAHARFDLGQSATLWARAPRAELAPYVDALFYAFGHAPPGGVSTYSHFPGPCPWLIVQLGEPLLIGEPGPGGTHRRSMPRVAACGLYDRPTTMRATGPSADISVRIKPEAASLLFGTGPGALRNTHVDLRDAWGPAVDTLLDRLSEAATREARFAIVEDALLSRVRNAPAPSGAMRAAVRLLRAKGGANAVRDASERLGMTPRNLNLLFHRHLGASPKRFARLARFSRIATSLGGCAGAYRRWDAPGDFFDDAHFIRDFKAHTGLTPLAFASRLQGGDSPHVVTAPWGSVGDYGGLLVLAG